MSATTQAQARLARRVQQVLVQLSEAVSEYADDLENALSLVPGSAPPAPELPPDLGKRQREIVELLTYHAREEGLKTAEIARRIDMEQPNTYLTLQALAKRGVAEMVPGVEPQHWRLAPRFRQGRRIAEVAALVRQGEWTSYGDISQVVYGHARAGLAVGSAARSVGFPNPHRVVQWTGQIPSDWIDQEGRGAVHCRELLEAEGVEVDDDLFAHGKYRVTHEELARRVADRNGGDAD